MQLPKTSELQNTEPASPLVGRTTTRSVSENTRRNNFRTMTKGHVNDALTIYLRSMSLIDDNEHVTNFNKAPDALDVKIERTHE